MKLDNSSLMKRVIRLAEKARGMTSPNPMVGAVLVKNSRIIAEDYHRKPGTPHAEALVIQKAGNKAKGSVLYVSLEPCCHTDKRTPPCTKAIIGAGIKKVVIGMKDPNPKVSGKGIKELEKAGIKTVSGILKEDAIRLNEGYIKYIKTGMPFVILKVAMTLDGKIATPEGESKWITGEKARKEVHKIRASVDAIMTAIGTVKADDPRLTARITRLKDPRFQTGKQPKRIIIDPDLKIPINAKILQTPPETIVVTKSVTNKNKKQMLQNKGIQIVEYKGMCLDLNWLMKILGEKGIMSLLIEGGSSLNSYALESGVVDKVMFFIAPKIIGGEKSFPAVGGKTFRKLADAYHLRDVKIKHIADDILIEGYLRNISRT